MVGYNSRFGYGNRIVVTRRHSSSLVSYVPDPMCVCAYVFVCVHGRHLCVDFAARSMR